MAEIQGAGEGRSRAPAGVRQTLRRRAEGPGNAAGARALCPGSVGWGGKRTGGFLF